MDILWSMEDAVFYIEDGPDMEVKGTGFRSIGRNPCVFRMVGLIDVL